MKLIYAGISSVYSLDRKKFQFNCTRNPQCQQDYFVPLRTTKDLFFYVDLPGKPLFIDTVIVETCGDTESPIVFDKYIVGQKPDNTWYGVFQTTVDFTTYSRFFFKFTFDVSPEEHIYYSEQFELDTCAPLICLKGCYPNEPVGSSAFDCNGIYYGLHAGTDTALGTLNFRYFHQACVRRGQLIPTSAKLTLSLFNTKRTYKSVLEREQTLEFELVPNFYKDFLLSIFARGNVEIGGVVYTLQTEQNWKVLDFNSKLWQLDTLLFEQCKQWFGCAPAVCFFPIICSNSMEIGTSEWRDGDNYYQLFDGIMPAMATIEWQLLDMDRNEVDSGEINSAPWSFLSHGNNITADCFILRWRVVCESGASAWKEEQVGDCSGGPVAIEGTFSIYSYGGGGTSCTAQGWTKLRFRFAVPLPSDVTLHFAGYYFPDNGSGTYNPYGGEIIPGGHPEKGIFNTGLQEAFTIFLPAGTTDLTTGFWRVEDPPGSGIYEAFESFPTCNATWGSNARHKFYFTAEGGAVLNFSTAYDTPGPYNTINGGILAVTQIL